MVFLDICRSIADSTLELSLVSVALIAVFAINQIMAAPLGAFEDGPNVPDVRITGYTPDGLNLWYDNIGVEGCDIYIRCTHWDFFPIMPTYSIFLGSLIIKLARTSGLDERFAFVPLATVVFDIIETYIQREGCVIFPKRLANETIQLASIACRIKWVLLLASILMIVQVAAFQKMKSLVRPSTTTDTTEKRD